jgi:hypothetical protein
MELHEIVMKLIGPVQPAGDSRLDESRLANMKTLTSLVEELLAEIEFAVPMANREEASMKKIGLCAREFLDSVKTPNVSSAPSDKPKSD